MLKVNTLPPRLTMRRPNPSLQVLKFSQALELNPRSFVETIIWGWKRDSIYLPISRTVYFSGQLNRNEEGVWINESFFFYAHWGPNTEMEAIVTALNGTTCQGECAATTDFEVVPITPNSTLVRIVSGRASDADLQRLTALASRQPDYPTPTPPPDYSESVFSLRSLGVTGCDLLAGSGLGYEAGLPMLKDVHDIFWVDDQYDGFCLGAKDKLPNLLIKNIDKMFSQFASWHIQAARAKPSVAHRCLALLRRAGFLHNIYTDSIDRLLTLVGIDDYIQVRGSGIVNEFQPVIFHPDSNALMVVGVSADRRGIISQARKQGLKIIVINPYMPVSPGAKNLDYLRKEDIYYRLTAGEAVPRILAETLSSSDFEKPYNSIVDDV